MESLTRSADVFPVRFGGPPLPDLVAHALREAIADGRFKSGQRLPSEPQLAEQLGVSRATLRQALSRLTQEGLLVRQHGRGTFISALPQSALHGNLTELVSTTQMIRDQGYQAGVAGCQVELTAVEAWLSDLFLLPADSRFFYISRTRLANGYPAVYSNEYLPASFFGPDSAFLQEGKKIESLYEILLQANIDIAFATCKVIPTVADEVLASRLRVKVGHPLLVLKQLHYTKTNQPVLYSENYHNCEFIEFQTVRQARNSVETAGDVLADAKALVDQLIDHT
ncbi:MAG TPA: GntR family transcriptional regulator [Ktedonobacteraceae bacterium]